jgi:nitrite reductase/ring-hydroxylating ferredoxin subunit
MEMTQETQAPVWWAIARSEEVTSKKPLSTDIGAQPVVLWRDNSDVARALEDRCPHRRAPLSLGCVRDNGWIQCGYHGWSYEGETGRLKEIPNMKDQQRFPPLYKAIPFAVHESNGFVRVCLDAAAAAPASLGKTYALSGAENVALDHKHYLDAFFDNAGLVIAIKGVKFTPYLQSELREEDGWLVMERSCQWAPRIWPSAFSSDFPITLLSKTHPVTGETHITLRNENLEELLRATLAPVPSARGVTAVRWRAELGEKSPSLPWSALWGENPLTVLPHIDGAALREQKPSVSIHGAQLRAQLADGSIKDKTDAA